MLPLKRPPRKSPRSSLLLPGYPEDVSQNPGSVYRFGVLFVGFIPKLSKQKLGN